jgi:hypothetical protein
MKRLLLGLSLLVLLCTPLFADEIGHARQHPIDDSGIQGHIFIVDTGNSTDGLIVLGTATGLDPTKAYMSLLYDNGSVPGGPDACEPSTPDPLTGAQMFVGFWTVDPDGTGSLLSRKRGASYVALSEVRTVSIRQAPRAPGNLRACGEIGRNQVK